MTISKETRKKILGLVPFILIIALSLAVFFYFDPEQIINYIGLENAYAMMFVFSFLAGVTTFNTAPYYSVLLLLATAGLNPIFLGLTSAIGVMCGDSFSYLLGKHGGELIPHVFKNIFEKINKIALKHPKTFPIFCFIYGSISPLSNDLITISAGMAKIPYLRMIIPLALGNIVFNVSFAYLCVYATSFITSYIS